MPVTSIRVAKRPYASIQYMLTKKGHNGRENRNEYVSFVNMDPDLNPVTQMSRVWHLKGSRVEILGRTVIQSFSRNELDPDNPASAYIAHMIGVESLAEFAGTKQAFCVTQKDGKSGLLHNHWFINNVDPVTFQGMKGDNKKKGIKCEYSHARLVEISDRTASKYITLDPGLEHGKKKSAYERRREIDNEAIRRENENIREWNDDHLYEPKKQIPYRAEKYVWKDAIRSTIEKCARITDSWDAFKDKMSFYGVDVKEGKNGKYVTYTLKSTEDYKISEWSNACDRIRKENADRKKNGQPPLPKPYIDDFEPKHKLSARDRSLGKQYSKQGVTDMILGIDPERAAQIEAARAAEEKRAREAQAALDAHEEAIADEEQAEEEYDQDETVLEYEPYDDDPDESTDTEAPSEEKSEVKTVSEPVPEKKPDEPVKASRPGISIFRRKRSSAVPVKKNREEDPDDIMPKADEEMIPVIGERSYEAPEQKSARQRREEREAAERQKRNQRSFWKARKKQDDHTDLSEIFQDWRKKTEERKEKGDEDEFGG